METCSSSQMNGLGGAVTPYSKLPILHARCSKLCGVLRTKLFQQNKSEYTFPLFLSALSFPIWITAQS